MAQDCRVVASTVVRVAPTGFAAPYVLAAVRTARGLALGRIDVGPDDAPLPGTALEPVGAQDGVTVYRPAPS
jgi:uncharacterized OB-fold protein